MKSLWAGVKILLFSFMVAMPLLLIGCAAPPPPAPTPEPKLEPTVTSTEEKLKVHFIKMERSGDAILIDLGETEILIDSGFPSPDVVTYLKNHVDGSLDVMVATHPHPDHIGGLVNVLVTFDVDEIWLNGDHLNLSPEAGGTFQSCKALPKIHELGKK